MVDLGSLLLGLDFKVRNRSVADLGEIGINGLCCDSRTINSGELFFAFRGAKRDAKDFLPEVIGNGAVAVCVEQGHLPAEFISSCPVPVIELPDLRGSLSQLASQFFGQPTDQILNIGVTGTNGKTSVAWIASSLLSVLSTRSALVGTLGMGVFPENSQQLKPVLVPTANTSPEPIELNRFLAEAVSVGVKAAVYEVTSQALVQKRTSGISWDAGIFTNLSRDHLDLHGSMERYGEIKGNFFKEDLRKSNKSSKIAAFNLDDSFGREIFAGIESKGDLRCVTYSSLIDNKKADVYPSRMKQSLKGTEIEISFRGSLVEFKTCLLGDYNVSNVIAALSCLYELGYDLSELQGALPRVLSVPGRLERVGDAEVMVFVDYAHTPDALVNVQSSLRGLCGDKGRLITVFGCGGDRDRGKRPLMGQAVCELSDIGVLTSDNPRTENPQKIVEDIIPGVSAGNCRQGFKWFAVVDRREAIAKALSLAEAGDVVLVAGKGHEDYQESGGVKYHFADVEVCLEEMTKSGIL